MWVTLESGPLERNVVVELAAALVAAAATTTRRTLVVVVRRAGLAATTAAARTAAATTTVVTAAAAAHAATAAVEHLHFVGDDFRGVAVLALLVLPLARAQRAFDVDLAAFFQVLAGDLAETPEHGHVVPLGGLLVLYRLLVFLVFNRGPEVVFVGIALGHG